MGQDEMLHPTALTYCIKVHGFSLDLSSLLAAFGVSVTQRVLRGVAEHFEMDLSKATARERGRILKAFGEWLAVNWPLSSPDKAIVGGSDVIQSENLEKAVHSWATSVKQRSVHGVSETTIGEAVNHIGRLLDVLAQRGILPGISRPKMRPNYHRTGSKRKSFAELSALGNVHSTASLMSQLKSEVRDLASIEGADDFLRALIPVMEEMTLSSPKEVILAIQNLNGHRISTLRALAEDDLLSGIAEFEYGQQMRSDHSDSMLEYFRRMATSSQSDRRKITSEHFSANGWHDDAKLAQSFVHYVYDECDGVCPTEKNFEFGTPIFQRLMQRLGGRGRVKQWFGAGDAAVSAAALIYMIDTAANPGTCFSLTPDFEERSDVSGHVEVVGIKRRPKPKGIVETLPVKDIGVRISTVQSLRAIKKMTDPYREQAPALRDRLFIHSFFKPNALTSETLSDRLRYLCRNDKRLSQLSMTPAQIRTSVLLNKSLANGGSILVPSATAHHGQSGGVTEGYTVRFPTKLLYAQKIRDFQDDLEIDVIFKIEGAIEALSISQVRVEKSQERSIRTGLGPSCGNPRAGVQPGTSVDADCDKIDACTGCEMKVIRVTLETLTDFILLRDHLLANQPEWEATREQRWNAVWLPYLALCEVVIEKVRRSAFAKLLDEAFRNAQDRRAEGFVPLPLY